MSNKTKAAPMANILFVPKQSNNCADTFLMLGLAQIANAALSQTRQNTDMQLVDRGTHYQIEFKKPVNLEAIAQLRYSNPFPPVCGAKSDRSKIPSETPIFDAAIHAEKRKLYRAYQYQTGGKVEWSEDAPQPPDPRTQNGAILTSMRHDRNHNSLWQECWQLKDHYGSLVAQLFQTFSQETPVKMEAAAKQLGDRFYKLSGCKIPTQASAVKIYLPTAVQGVNRIKADGNKVDPQKADWLSLWLIAGGFFEFALSERVKLAEKVYDWRVVSLDPKDISFEKYREVLNTLRQYNPPGGGHGIARFDAELVLKFCQELLNHHQTSAKLNLEDEFDLWEPVNHFVSGFTGTHFNAKGQVYGVKELFKLGLPGWISPENYDELLDYLTLLKEHLWVITSLSVEDSHSEILAAYRDFITGSNLTSFFRFQIGYADYVIKRLADPHAKPPRLFSVTGLNIMTQKDRSFVQITRDPSFLRIAKAINQSTVNAGKIQTKNGPIEFDWQRQYGLAQQLSSQSGSKKDFISAIADFLGKYEHENVRLSEQYLKQGKPLKRIWPTKDDLDRLIELVEEFDTVLVANLLIAYGYAKWTKPKEEDNPENTEINPEEPPEESD